MRFDKERDRTYFVTTERVDRFLVWFFGAITVFGFLFLGMQLLRSLTK